MQQILMISREKKVVSLFVSTPLSCRPDTCSSFLILFTLAKEMKHRPHKCLPGHSVPNYEFVAFKDSS